MHHLPHLLSCSETKTKLSGFSRLMTFMKHVRTSRNVNVRHSIGYELRTQIKYVYVEQYGHRTIVYDIHTGKDVRRLYQDVMSDSNGNPQD
jgi:hypothetical protein